MNDLNTIEKTQFFKELQQTFEYQNKIAQENYSKSLDDFNDKLEKTDFKDKNISLILKEMSTSTGNYNKKLQDVLNQYLKSTDSKEVEKTNNFLKDILILQEKNSKQEELNRQFERKKSLVNPLNAFKYAKEDYKTGGLKESLKQQMTFKNLTKGLLHTVGIAMDNPALNILASNIESDTIERDEQNEKLNNLVKSFSTEDAKSKEFTVNMTDYLKEDKQDIEDVKEFMSSDDLKPVLEDSNYFIKETYVEFGKILEDIRELNKEHLTKITSMENMQKTSLMIQKDAADDRLATTTATTTATGITTPAESVSFDEKPKEGSILDEISGFMDFGGKDKKGRFKKMKGLLKSGGKVLTTGASVLGKVALPLAAIVSTFEGLSGWFSAEETLGLKEGQKATVAEKTSSALGSIASGLSFGTLDEKEISKTISENIGKPAELIKSLFTDDNTKQTIDRLEEQGAIYTSVLGDSAIRDYDAIKNLPKQDIKSLIKYDDWSDTDMKFLKQLEQTALDKEKFNVTQNIKSTEPALDIENVQPSTENIQALEDKITDKQYQPIIQVPEPKVIVAPSVNKTPQKIDQYALEDNNFLTYLTVKGVRF